MEPDVPALQSAQLTLKRVTPSEARAKLLHALINQSKASLTPTDRETLDATRAEFVQAMLLEDDLAQRPR